MKTKVINVSDCIRENTDKTYFINELISAISDNYDKIIITTHEGFCFKITGIYNIVKTICDLYHFSYDKICLENTDLLEKNYSPFEYRIKDNQEVWAIAYNELKQFSLECEWDKSYLFGQFCRAVRPARLSAFYYMHNLNLQKFFYSSFNSSFDDIYEKQEINWIKENPEKYISIKDYIPYSDFDTPQREYFCNFEVYTDWHSVYKKIGLEIIYETLEYDSFFLTEKTVRALYFKRPFIVIGSKNFEFYLKDKLGIHIFDEYIDKSYNDYGGVCAAETVMCSIVPTLIKNNTIQKIHNEAQEQLEHNQKRIIELCKEHYNKWKKIDR